MIGEVVPAEKGERGYLLDMRFEYGLPHYDQPIFFLGPGFPFALMVSNRLFSKDGKYRAAVTCLNRIVREFRPEKYYEAQFFAVIVPLFFNLLLILLTYLLGTTMFNHRIGLYAAFILAIHPISILSGQRLWTDDMTTAFLTMSVLGFVIYLKRLKWFYLILSGICLGLSTLTRQTSGLIIVCIFLFYGLSILHKLNSMKKIPLLFFNRVTILITIAFICTTFFWFARLFKEYGTFLYMPNISGSEVSDRTGWWQTTRSRPHPILLFFIGAPVLSPLFLFIYSSVKDTIDEFKELVKKGMPHMLPLLWIWVFGFFMFIAVMNNEVKEHRYMIPMYPALAILSAYGLAKLKNAISKRVSETEILLPEFSIIAILIICAFWSVPRGMYQAMINSSLIIFPF